MAESGKNHPQIILYHYPFSPYARRIIWYLTLRRIPYAEVRQPPVMPRPDLDAIGVKYRRIPVLAVGKDVYCDTRIILEKLERLFPEGALGASSSHDLDQLTVQKLLEGWTIEGGVFMRASQLIPSDMPLLNDPKFTKDREQLTGRPWNKNAIDANRPEALVHIRNAFRFLEHSLLADGRDWVLKGDKPSLADIHAVWPFDWLNGLKGALPKDLISEKQFPRTFAWIARFNEAVKHAKTEAPKVTTLKGPEAASQILKAEFAEKEGSVDTSDPTGLRHGDRIQVYPVDSGFSHRDTGQLAVLTPDEAAITLGNGLRLHAPRVGFRIKPVDAASKL